MFVTHNQRNIARDGSNLNSVCHFLTQYKDELSAAYFSCGGM